MNWLNAKYASESVAILVLSGCALYAVRDWHQTNLVLRAGVVQTLGNINRPCGKQPCGTLATLNKTVVKIGDAVVTTQLQERQIGQHTSKDMDTVTADIQASLKPLPAAIQSFSEAATALTGTAHSASGVLQTAQTTIQSFQPVAADADATVRHFDDLIQSPAITQTLQNVSATTAHINAIAADSYTVEHRYFFRPACKTLGCRMKSVAMFAYGAGKMAETGYWVKQLILGGSQ